MKTDELREKYLAFFETKGCVRRPSDVLVPTWDPSVLFTPAGMNQFKDHFLGRCKLEFRRATTCQKCLRTGDIDNVGRTPYHHTFFEMLGNFSFGDYFKRETISWAWEFLTNNKWLGIDPQRLTVSVYVDDDEAAGIWEKEVGLAPSKVARMGEDDNFWPAGAPSKGPDGVCGPCSEIFFHPNSGKEVEIWNLVFTQFNRSGPPPDNLHPLPSRNIDTGMGLERTAATLQGVESNFHIDILLPIVRAAADVCGKTYDPVSDDGRRLRRITDHVRACTFAVHENVYPGPNAEKYVIRRLIRRAVLDGHQMAMREPFLYRLVPVVVEMMKAPYPELVETAERVAKVIQQEEGRFLETVESGLERIERIFADTTRRGTRAIAGDDIFFMYDTHGFPPELFEQIAKERGFEFDWEGYKKLKEEAAGTEGPVDVFKAGPLGELKQKVKSSEFLGYTTTAAQGRVVGIIAGDALRETLSPGGKDPATIVLDRTPFYGEAGGQVGDIGELAAPGVRFEVTDTQKDGDLILHIGHLRQGELRTGMAAEAKVDARRRQAIRRAHSATHILHYALQKHLGKHAQQQGSKVDDDWLRFDFTNLEPVGGERLARIASEVEGKVAAAQPVSWKTVSLAEARSAGAMMLFGEKYPDPCRMVSMGDFSRELCGGTHLDNTSEVGPFELVGEEAVSAGVRRVVALTGEKAKDHAGKVISTLEEAAKLLSVAPTEVPARVSLLTKELRELKKQLSGGGKGAPAGMPTRPQAATAAALDRAAAKSLLDQAARELNVGMFDVPPRVAAMLRDIEQLRQQVAQAAAAPAAELSADDLLAGAFDVGGAKVVVAEAAGANPNVMRQLIDQVRKKVAPSAVLLASAQGDKALLVAGLSRELVAKGADAGRWLKETAPIVGGSGGGKPDLAQAGGKEPAKLPEALAKAREVIREMLAG
jgi:alanyl-tRNA synthetase